MDTSEKPFPVVGIGASAGGLEAFSLLLQHLPVDTGMGFVLVQHLDPDHQSTLAGLLARTTSMPVCEVTDNLPVLPDHVYVIPPNASMVLARGKLRLERRERTPGPPRSIDNLFESLARHLREYAIGVILSGTGSDGTLGLEAIKAEGGITFAQDASARYDSMPRSAIAAGCVDLVLSPEAIAQELARVARHPSLKEGLERAAELPLAAEKAGQDLADAGGDFQKVLLLLREVRDKQGHWFDMRANPFLTLDNRVDGAVLLLLDIGALKHTEQQIREQRDFAEAVIESVPPLLILKPALQVLAANEAFYHAFHVSSEETVGRLVFDLGNGQWNIPKLRTLLQEVLPANRSFKGYEVSHDSEKLGRRTMLLSGRRVQHLDLILLAIEDITVLKEAEETARKAKDVMARYASDLEGFSYSLVHDMRAPLRAMRSFASLIEENDGQRLSPESQDYLQRIGTSARRLDQLVCERLHRSDEYPGTGIGLALVRKVVHRMGGTVGLESAPGQGSKFWVELPKATPT